MPKILKLPLLVFLISITAPWLTACTAYGPGIVPGSPSDAPSGDHQVKEVSIGDQVRVTPWSGETHFGRVKKLSEDEIILEKTGNYGHEEILISLGDIKMIEIEKVGGALDLASGTVLILGAVLVSFAVFFRASGGIGN